MLSFALYDTREDECAELSCSLSNNIALLSDEELKLIISRTYMEILSLLEKDLIFDMGCLDITPDKGIRVAEEFRRRHPNAMLMLIADGNISPLEYIRPTIMAAGLILRPCTPESAHENLKNFIKNYIDSHSLSSTDEFVIETRDDIVRVPYDKILYIEAREKKVFIRVEYEEYGYYDTLDSLIKILPDNFIRCHRGYIVNIDKAKKLLVTENLIELQDGVTVPVSRSMKKNIKDSIR